MSFKKFVDQQATIAGIKAASGECTHMQTELRSRTIRGGSTQYVRQCLFCGESVGNPQKQSGTVKPFDEALRESYAERRRTLRETAQREKSSEWWDNYREYLASDAWAEVRRKVLERDKYVCQGCLTAKATEAHHRTYDNFGAEFAFELLSLCRPCHQRYHEGDAE
jgi:5-methylcytosine-specific restriction endonuclease McrA